MLKKVASEVIQIQRTFLWGGEKEGRFSPLVKWQVIQKPKWAGGLGVGDLMLQNAALLFKW